MLIFGLSADFTIIETNSDDHGAFVFFILDSFVQYTITEKLSPVKLQDMHSLQLSFC